MITTLGTSHPVARKPHECMFCGCKINPGQRYERQTNVYDGQIYDFICHDECDSVAHELGMYQECDYDEGLTSDYFIEAIDEYVNDKHYDKETDDTSADWVGLTPYETVCKINNELQAQKNDQK